VESSWGAADVSVRLLGEFNADNVLSVLAVLLAWDVPLAEAARALGQCTAAPGRMEAFGGRGSAPLAIVDYAHTPDALANALRAARSYCRGRLRVVFGCGGDRDRGKRALMGRVAGELADEIQRLRPDGLLIAFAFARYVRETVLMVRLAAQKGVPTIVITDSPLSPPAQPAHIVLTVETQHRAHRLSYVAALSVANALASTVAYRSWEHSARYASASEELFRDTETFWSRL
ncbi:MAG: SIS domain-containing protein, partial [Limnochordales bacterium]